MNAMMERLSGRCQGNGHPDLGRILAVCDSFDAMVSRRAYKDALSVEYAIGELEKEKARSLIRMSQKHLLN